ncbi:hypothetical protein JGUZn3_10220 [Entomobacter blattae]|uniref:Uncharacterized protein n=1 Tax=Entomobacter blattae TaxID=2762277 RepID=A0A7H1NR40_9PROT|nr:hypothetical protein JGUZn3_10220 [Entomobacter blattae]
MGPLLYLVQNQILEETGRSWIPKVVMDEVAMILDMAPIRVYEVASFYTKKVECLPMPYGLVCFCT